MNQAMFVDMLKSQSRLPHQLADIRHAKRMAVLDEFGQVHARDEIHDQEVDSVGLPGVDGANDVWVIEPAHSFHFAMKARDCLGAVVAVGGENLEGNDLVQLW